MPLVYLSLGANCGFREKSVKSALDILSSVFSEFTHSGLYETPDLHGSEKKYVNTVASGYTFMSAEAIDALAKKLELQAGRDAEARAKGDVPLDIDLVIYGDKIVKPRDYACNFFTLGYRELKENQ